MAFAQHGRNKVQMPPKSYLYFTEHNGDLRTMPAFLEEEDVAGVKVVNVHPENRKVGLPTVMATVILNSTSTGAPLAIMDGTYLMDIRTGAAGVWQPVILHVKTAVSWGWWEPVTRPGHN
jgi:alanine dehydrogenase